MTTTEHLAKVRAKCVELLEIAEKRTPGKWKAGTKGFTIGGLSYTPKHVGTLNVPVTETDLAFIAACAGPAEAGWRSTIAAIDWIQSIRHSEGPKGTHELCNSILSAWPEETL